MIGELFLIKRANVYPYLTKDYMYPAFTMGFDPQVALNKKLRQYMPTQLSGTTQWNPGKLWDFNKPKLLRVNISYPLLGGTATTLVNIPLSTYQDKVDELEKWRRDSGDSGSKMSHPAEQTPLPTTPGNSWEEASKKYEEAEMQYELQLAHQEKMKKLRDHYLSRDDEDEDDAEPFDDGESYHGEWKTEDVRNNGVRYNPNAANPFFQRDRLLNLSEALKKSLQEYDTSLKVPVVKAPLIPSNRFRPGQIRNGAADAERPATDRRLTR